MGVDVPVRVIDGVLDGVAELDGDAVLDGEKPGCNVYEPAHRAGSAGSSVTQVRVTTCTWHSYRCCDEINAMPRDSPVGVRDAVLERVGVPDGVGSA